ncbi:hypothetical protein [Halocalculus aciditolerans]|uniref:Uncharacterized protein n=1 Tax=Halocalculus aciditolerans TaxID=1383812 RepID=A0A830FBJ6_9EURY|nr:hypothetical protein [Halocalculus aciditolerans]GGL73326.1 hypothetical protein GCM10009039_34320 [Halocalculus aciditolerans]
MSDITINIDISADSIMNALGDVGETTGKLATDAYDGISSFATGRLTSMVHDLVEFAQSIPDYAGVVSAHVEPAAIAHVLVGGGFL